MKTRRDFIKLSATGMVGTIALGTSACGSTSSVKKGVDVGIQLYTVRDAMTQDPIGTLKKVAQMGYKNLELANYNSGKFYNYAPAELKKIVSDLGMKVVSSHTQVEAKGITIDNAKRMAEAHAELGVEYCVQPWVNDVDRSIERYKTMIGDWNEVGRIMKDVGIQFAYHNHNFEFKEENGIIPYFDIFMKEMDPELITMELDMYWVNKAGYDPVELFKRFPGRFQLFHFKDMQQKSAPFYDVVKNDITSVGEGLIDFKAIYEAREIAGMKYLFVEDDNQGNGKPFEAIETSINNITSKIIS